MNATEDHPTQGVHILIVEDSPTQAMKLLYLLERQGYHVTAASNGKEALAALSVKVPTLVVTDVNMPEMDGYELCHNIKDDPSLQTLPVILLTSLSDPRDILRGLECGADNFIVKPYNEEFLLSRIHYVLANLELRRTAENGQATEVYFAGQKYQLKSPRLHSIELLLSTYETAVQRNLELEQARAALEAKAQELARSNNDLEQFGYIVSHDLQEPLRMVTSYLDLIKLRYRDKLDESAMEYMHFAIDGAKRMRLLIYDLLAYARVGTYAAAFTPTNLEDVFSAAMANLKIAIEESHATVSHDPLPTIPGDSTQLLQLLQNLVANALKFCGETPPAIHVGAAKVAGYWRISVSDNGIGIPQDAFGRIFQVFQRLHTREAYPGTGIGLAVCKKIIERHGGQIGVESAHGEGSTFFFTLENGSD